MESVKVSQVAKSLGVTTQAVYKKIATLGNRLAPHVAKEKGVTYLTAAGLVIIKEAFGNKPQESVSLVGNVVATLEGRVTEQNQIIANQQRTIEALIAQQEEARKRTDTILMKLTTDISSLQKALEYKPTEEKATPPPEVKPLPVAVSNNTAPIRAEVPRKVVQKPQVQRELTTWESVTVFLDDCAGLLFGRG